MRNITLQQGESITVHYGDRSIVIGVGNDYHKQVRFEEQDFTFYLTDDRNGQKHTSFICAVEYSDHDLLWGNVRCEATNINN